MLLKMATHKYSDTFKLHLSQGSKTALQKGDYLPEDDYLSYMWFCSAQNGT